jgi:hypothetical protein
VEGKAHFDWPLPTGENCELDFWLNLPEVFCDEVGGVANADGKPAWVRGYIYMHRVQKLQDFRNIF